MPIKDIKHFIDSCMEGDSKIDERLAIIKSQRESVVRQMEEMQKMQDMLDYKCWYYETAKAAGTCAVHDDIKPEDVPEKFHQRPEAGETPGADDRRHGRGDPGSPKRKGGSW